MLHMKDVSNEADFLALRRRPVGLLLRVSPKTVWLTVSLSSLAGVITFIIFLLVAIF